MSKSIWYNSNELFSRQSPFNFVMGERGNGKSFDAKTRMIKNFINKGEQSVYLRRRQTDVDGVKDNFFDDVGEFFPDHEFKVEGGIGYISGKPAIHFIALSTAYKTKSKPFPKVTLIVFDEYIEPATKFPNYFKDDMTKLLDVINTIVRSRNNWRLVLIGNAISYVNPFFTFYNILIRDNKKRFHSFKKHKITGNPLITVELTETPMFREEYKKTNFAQLIEGTEYGEYSMNAVAFEDNNNFILSERTGQHIFICSLYYLGQEVGIWFNSEGNIYCDKIIDQSSPNKFCVIPEDMKEGYQSIKMMSKWRRTEIHSHFGEGTMFYVNQEIKKLMNEIIRYI